MTPTTPAGTDTIQALFDALVTLLTTLLTFFLDFSRQLLAAYLF